MKIECEADVRQSFTDQEGKSLASTEASHIHAGERRRVETKMAQTLASLTTSVTQTLETFEHRIHEIENTMGDLHRDTQKLSGMEKSTCYI